MDNSEGVLLMAKTVVKKIRRATQHKSSADEKVRMRWKASG
jgi:hypothetical protein